MSNLNLITDLGFNAKRLAEAAQRWQMQQSMPAKVTAPIDFDPDLIADVDPAILNIQSLEPTVQATADAVIDKRRLMALQRQKKLAEAITNPDGQSWYYGIAANANYPLAYSRRPTGKVDAVLHPADMVRLQRERGEIVPENMSPEELTELVLLLKQNPSPEGVNTNDVAPVISAETVDSPFDPTIPVGFVAEGTPELLTRIPIKGKMPQWVDPTATQVVVEPSNTHASPLYLEPLPFIAMREYAELGQDAQKLEALKEAQEIREKYKAKGQDLSSVLSFDEGDLPLKEQKPRSSAKPKTNRFGEAFQSTKDWIADHPLISAGGAIASIGTGSYLLSEQANRNELERQMAEDDLLMGYGEMPSSFAPQWA